MTPPARLQAAIEVLDVWLSGAPVEKALTNWARGARYAGSKDRAAVRDIIFDCLRRKTECAALGGNETGRGLVLGYTRLSFSEDDVGALFSGEGHGPTALDETEMVADQRHDEEGLANWPKWLQGELETSMSARDAIAVTKLLGGRAPVFLRVNRTKSDMANAQASLMADGIETKPHTLLSDTALEVVSNPRKVAASAAFLNGLVELQDAASQAVCDTLPDGVRILDYCAGGGGKSLGLAARLEGRLFATDIAHQRMNDLPNRAVRAGAQVTRLKIDDVAEAAPFDVILCDAPCSGSGAWRRSPEGKWRLTPQRLAEIQGIQREIMSNATQFLTKDGVLAYATCSLFQSENEAQVASFMKENTDWHCSFERRFSPLEGGDGFYIAHLTRARATS